MTSTKTSINDLASRLKTFFKNPLYFGITIGFLTLVLIFVVISIFQSTKNGEPSNSELAAASEEQGAKEREKYPILAELPVKNALFSIGYQLEDGGDKLVVKITTTETYLDSAIAKLTNSKTDLTGISLEISEPKNPFLSAYIVNGEQNPSAALKTAYAKIDNFQVAHLEYVNSNDEIFDMAHSDDFSAVNRVLAKITTGSAATYDLQTYRVVLKRDENRNFIPVANPAPLLNIYNTPGVPAGLLNSINNI